MILDGRIAAQWLLEQLRQKLSQLKTAPRLAILQSGEHPASNLYVSMKKQAATQIGVEVLHIQESFVSYDSCLDRFRQLVQDPSNTAVLVQLPLLGPMGGANLKELEERMFTELPAIKDADGLSVQSQGALFTGLTHPDRWTHPIAATPMGVYRLLQFYGVPIAGKKIAVLGRSRLVGKPMAQIFLQSDASVLQIHSRSTHVDHWIEDCDIVVVAIGQPEGFKVKLKKSAVLIDVGIHRLNGKTLGDCSDSYEGQVAARSPVPGGVGPMTVACLMENVVRLALLKQKLNLTLPPAPRELSMSGKD
jgi:5,10-methylene-tetrahydrofolate dehydrogenase/methenyl tetrahydrofolate cyclohydrolase